MALNLDIPAWVQAVGSVAAILAAIRISRAEDRRRRREAVDAAEVTGALVRSKLLDMRAAMVDVRSAYARISQAHDGLLRFFNAANRVVAIPVPTEEQLIRLTASPITGAADIAELISRLERVRTLLPTVDWSADMRGDNQPVPSASSGLMEDLAEIEALVIAAHATLLRFKDLVEITRDLRKEAQTIPSWKKQPLQAAKWVWGRIWP